MAFHAFRLSFFARLRRVGPAALLACALLLSAKQLLLVEPVQRHFAVKVDERQALGLLIGDEVDRRSLVFRKQPLQILPVGSSASLCFLFRSRAGAICSEVKGMMKGVPARERFTFRACRLSGLARAR